MVTIKDIAKETGVSIATVSNIINGKNKAGAETEKRVLAAVEKLGYKPNNVAKGLRSKKTQTIGIIVEDVSQFTVPPIIESIMRVLEEAGYHTVLKNLRLYSRWSDQWFHNEEMVRLVAEPAISELLSNMTDGIIYVAVHMRYVNLFPEDPAIPVVMTYASEKNTNIPSILIDDESSACQGMKYVLNKGHKRIGVIGGNSDNLHTVFRYNGVRKALSEAGLEVRESLFRFPGWEKEHGYAAIQELMKEEISAVFCFADRIAGGVYQYLSEQGLSVGRDLSVMGYDNQYISEFFLPGLTTMALPLYEIGKTAAELLLTELTDGDKNTGEKDSLIKLPCKLIERASVAPFS